MLGVALFGLLWIQFLWISNSVNASTKEFDSDVKKVLAVAGNEVEEHSYCINFNSSSVIPRNKEISFISQDNDSSRRDTIPFLFNNTFGEVFSVDEYTSLEFDYPIQVELNMKVKLILPDSILSRKSDLDIEEYGHDNSSLSVDIAILDSALARELVLKGIETNYNISVVNDKTKKEVYNSVKLGEEFDKEATYKQRIFNSSNFNSPHSIYVYFPDKMTVIWKSQWFAIGSSIVLLFVLIFLFISFIKMIYSQNKLVETRMDFVNNMTHEFRTPLSNMNLALGALKGAPTELEKDRLYEIIDEEKNRLSDGIELILTTALVDMKELSLNLEKISIHELINKVVNNSDLKFRQKNVLIELKLDANIDEIYVDEHHMINVIDNLIDNAIKYSGENLKIEIRTSNVKNGIEISFVDSGFGINNQDQKHIFDKFYRVSTQDRYESKGFGIGLFYVKMIIEAHKGSISVESSLGQGSTFKIYLPLKSHE